MSRLLLVDDDSRLTGMLGDYLRNNGFEVETAASLAAARSRLQQGGFDALVLDLMLPDGDGLDFTRELRSAPATRRLPLLMLTALLRRAAPHAGSGDDVLVFGRLEVDLGARQARLDGRPCDLTGHQFELLGVLARRPGRVLSRDQIMDALKGHPLEAFDRSIDVHISRIRAVIEDDPKAPRRVLTVRGAGYVFARKQDAE